jgi:hypothetical protein
MDHFYVTLPSDSSAYFFPNNTIASFRTKLATPIELEHDKWEVGLVEISYPRGYKKRVLYNTLRFDSTSIKFPVKHYESLNDLIAYLTRNFKSPNRKEQFITTFSELLNNYLPPHESTSGLLSTYHGQNSLQISENVVSHFPIKVYKNVEDLVETIMTPGNCRSFRVNLAAKDNFDFTLPEPVYVYTDIIKPNLVGDSYVRLLTSLHFPSATGYHTLNYPMYRPVEQSFIELIAIRVVTKTGENVVFEDSDNPCLVILHL